MIYMTYNLYMHFYHKPVNSRDRVWITHGVGAAVAVGVRAVGPPARPPVRGGRLAGPAPALVLGP